MFVVGPVNRKRNELKCFSLAVNVNLVMKSIRLVEGFCWWYVRLSIGMSPFSYETCFYFVLGRLNCLSANDGTYFKVVHSVLFYISVTPFIIPTK